MTREVNDALLPGGEFRVPSNPGIVRTVTLVGIVDLGARGKRLHLRAPDGQWSSPYSYVPGAPQGDPRWFMEYYGADAAGLFGFEMVDETNLYVPDTETINSAINTLNTALIAAGREPVLLTFNDPGLVGQSPPRDYLGDYGRKLCLPLPALERGIHDYSYHLLSINLPGELVRHSAMQTTLLLEVGEHLQTLANDQPLLKSAVDRVVENALVFQTDKIDLGTGNLAYYSIFKALNKQTGDWRYHALAITSSPHRVYSDIAGAGASAEAHVRGLLQANSHELSPSSRDWVLQHAQELMTARIERDGRLATELRLAPGSGAREPIAEAEALCTLAQVRRREIAEAAAQIGATSISRSESLSGS